MLLDKIKPANAPGIRPNPIVAAAKARNSPPKERPHSPKERARSPPPMPWRSSSPTGSSSAGSPSSRRSRTMSSLPAARTAPQLKRPNRPFQADGTFLTSVPSWSRPGSAAPAKKKEDDAEALLRARKLRAAAFAFKTARVVVKFKRLAPPAPRVDRQKVLSPYAKSSNLVKSGLMTRPTLISHRPPW